MGVQRPDLPRVLRCLMDKSTPVVRPIDEHATRIPMRSGLLPCLYVPIAARDTFAIERYVGRIAAQLMPKSPDKALLVEAYEPEKADARLAIWDVPEAVVLYSPRQVWVHVDYRAYRRDTCKRSRISI